MGFIYSIRAIGLTQTKHKGIANRSIAKRINTRQIQKEKYLLNIEIIGSEQCNHCQYDAVMGNHPFYQYFQTGLFSLNVIICKYNFEQVFVGFKIQ